MSTHIYILCPISNHSLFSQQQSYIFYSYHLNPKQQILFNMSDMGRQSLGDSESSFSPPLHPFHPLSLPSYNFLSFPLRAIRTASSSFPSSINHISTIRAPADLTRGWSRLEARLSVSTTISFTWSVLNVPGSLPSSKQRTLSLARPTLLPPPLSPSPSKFPPFPIYGQELTTSRKSFGQKAGDAVSGNQNENSGSIVDSVKVSTI